MWMISILLLKFTLWVEQVGEGGEKFFFGMVFYKKILGGYTFRKQFFDDGVWKIFFQILLLQTNKRQNVIFKATSAKKAFS